MAGPAIVELEHVCVSYRGAPVLEDVSLQVSRGDFLAVIGPNGSGKTTLLKVVLGLLRPDTGEVRVFGRAPRLLGGERWRIGYCPQVLSVDLNFPVRAGDAVLMGRYGRIGLLRRASQEDRAAARRAMERVGVWDLAERPIARLSGGQRQRVFLARALVADPDLLLLDEPTTGVDVASTESLYELLRNLHRAGISIVVVSHDVGVVASYVDAVACLNRRLVAHGRPEEVFASDALEQMYGCDAVLFHHGRVPHMVVERK
ncbi:MAG TPA: metal ABC transporter ATP-binding protein [Burkholderiales bacterium]|nr:metal ABC transporter ATP-binding protein [Burkholderiales bacterium]